MKNLLVILVVTLLASVSGSAFAADSAKAFDGTLKMAEGEVVSLAEAMPADKFDFAPKNGEFAKARTFGLQMKHIAAVNYMVAAAILGEKSPVDPGPAENGPDSIQGKDQIVRFLKESFAYTHKALQSVTDAKLTSQVNDPFGSGKQPLTGVATVPLWHTFDHYGQAVVYARMCGIVPPASRPK